MCHSSELDKNKIVSRATLVVMGDSPWTLRMTVFLKVDLQGLNSHLPATSSQLIHRACRSWGRGGSAVASNLYQNEESVAGHSAFFNNCHNSLLSSIFVVFHEGEKY